MKFVSFYNEGELDLGVATEKGILAVKRAAELTGIQAPGTMDELIGLGEEGLSAVKRLTDQALAIHENGLFHPADRIRYAPCVQRPEKLICVGLNYFNHAKESDMEVPGYPLLFSKFNNSLAAHQEIIPIPQDAAKIDYEAELVIVIGKTARNVSEEEALSCVFGYTIGNDLSARDLQFRTSQWLLGKSLDKFAPIGPGVVTADELGDPHSLNMECRVNGEIRQAANTKSMIFNCAQIISYASRYMTLKPGDLIFSGTPEGVILGYPEEEQVWLKPGDEITITIDKIGTLINVLSME